MVNAYELGQRRVPLLARTLGVSEEELIGEPKTAGRKRGQLKRKAASHA